MRPDPERGFHLELYGWLTCALVRHGQRRIATARSLGITRECLYR